jgi:hypothetical protein
MEVRLNTRASGFNGLVAGPPERSNSAIDFRQGQSNLAR